MTTKHCCEFSAAFQGLTDKLADQSKLVRLNQEHVAKADARIATLTYELHVCQKTCDMAISVDGDNQRYLQERDERITALTDALRSARASLTGIGDGGCPKGIMMNYDERVAAMQRIAEYAMARIDAVLSAQEGK